MDRRAGSGHYAHSHKAIAEAVQRALEARGWHAFRDDTDLEAGSALTTELAQAIDRAELFVAIVSEDYSASNPCMWELNLALTRKFGDDLRRVVGLRTPGADVPPAIAGALWVDISPGEEDGAVERMLRRTRQATQESEAGLLARPVAPPAGPATDPPPRELVREAVRYARELDALAVIDAALVEAQRAIEGAARSYDDDAYAEAYERWQEVWVRNTPVLTGASLIDQVQVIGSLLAEVVHSDRTPRELRPWMVQRAITSARACIGYAMRGEDPPTPAFPGTTELRDLLGRGDGEQDPFLPLRTRLTELGTPEFHPASDG